MKKKYLLLFLLLISWREVLFLLSQQADFFLKYSPSFPYRDHVLEVTQTPRWLYSWANFDGVHYLTIINMGYWGVGLVQAFFPLFPLTVRFFSSLINAEPLILGIYFSFVFFFIFLALWFKELEHRYNEKFAWKNIFILMFFPTAFFFTAMYSESFFLMWVVLTWYCARKKFWPLVGLSIAAASATRVIGVLLVPAVLLDLWVDQYSLIFKTKKSGLRKLIESLRLLLTNHFGKVFWVSCGALGLVSYMVFLYTRYHDPVAFFHAQSEFGAGRTTYIVTLPQVIWRSFKILQTVDHSNWKYFSYLQETVISLLFLGLWGVGAVKRHKFKLSWGELMFSAGAYLLPTLTGTFSSMPRYVLACLPLFVVLTFQLWTSKSYVMWLIISGFLLVLNTLLFIQGYWVA